MPIDLTLLHSQYEELSNLYPDLILIQLSAQEWMIKGLLRFKATYDQITIEDGYNIEIIIPDEFPNKPPTLEEKGNRIPDTFHRNDSGTRCLGSPLEVRMKFRSNPTLVGFVNHLVIPYLFSHTYWENNNEMPFGEWGHGGKGIIEYYQELFEIESEIAILGLLKILADNNYRGHLNCPCDSGLILRSCHGYKLREIITLQEQVYFQYEYLHVLTDLKKRKVKIPNDMISKTALKTLNAIKW